MGVLSGKPTGIPCRTRVHAPAVIVPWCLGRRRAIARLPNRATGGQHGEGGVLQPWPAGHGGGGPREGVGGARQHWRWRLARPATGGTGAGGRPTAGRAVPAAMVGLMCPTGRGPTPTDRGAWAAVRGHHCCWARGRRRQARQRVARGRRGPRAVGAPQATPRPHGRGRSRGGGGRGGAQDERRVPARSGTTGEGQAGPPR